MEDIRNSHKILRGDSLEHGNSEDQEKDTRIKINWIKGITLSGWEVDETGSGTYPMAGDGIAVLNFRILLAYFASCSNISSESYLCMYVRQSTDSITDMQTINTINLQIFCKLG
jgi:hypothetical protein